MEDREWLECPLVSIDPEVKHGAPVFAGTRLEVETVTDEVYAYMELCGQSEEQAIVSALESFPTTPGGAAAIRQLLAFRDAHEHQLQP